MNLKTMKCKFLRGSTFWDLSADSTVLEVKIGAEGFKRSKSLTQHRNLQDQIQTKYNINLISILILYFVCIYVGGYSRPVGTIQIYQSCQEDGDDRVPGWYHIGFGRITSQVRRFP